MGSFKDVVGHKDILKYISSAVENNRVSHAYILNGERGSGKKMLANLFGIVARYPVPHKICRNIETGNTGIQAN